MLRIIILWSKSSIGSWVVWEHGNRLQIYIEYTRVGSAGLIEKVMLSKDLKLVRD